MFPAKMKNGIAINVKFEIPENILCAPVTRVLSNANDGSIASIDDIQYLLQLEIQEEVLLLKH